MPYVFHVCLAPCKAGYYMHPTYLVCLPACPRGQYQTIADQPQCESCPAGMTTPAIVAGSSADCVGK